MLVIALLLGCRDEAPECRDGFEEGDEGLCYEVADTDLVDTEEPAPPTVEDVLAALPPCEPGATDGRLDIAAGCADGACAGMRLADIEEALGETGWCEAFYVDWGGYEFSSVSCSWSNGIGASFDDEDLDGVADPTSETYSISVDLPFDGGTTDGLDLGVGPACFVDVYGAPYGVGFDLDGGEWFATYLYFPDVGVSVWDDVVNKNGDYGPDGRVDSLTLYGSP